MDLKNIKDPSFLATYTNLQLKELADEIREFLIQSVSKTGGHLSSNLGTVELSIALHKVFNSPSDKILFDVGHQSYTHKILTGRAKDFDSLRQYNGLSGFQKRSESNHDVFEAGHAGTALSAAFGLATARSMNKENHHIISVVGDGSFTNGMCYEALNQIGVSKLPLIIILNDNDMAISKNVGHISSQFNQLRVTKSYNHIKEDVKSVLNKGGKVTKPITKAMVSLRNSIRKNVVSENIFSDFGIRYVGPFDGHNIAGLIRVLEYAKTQEFPIAIHLKTVKGKGYAPSENDNNGAWHGVSQFDPDTGESIVKLPDNMKSWSEIFSLTLTHLANDNPDIVAITPAMVVGSKLEPFFEKFPDRSFDTGITEEHAATFAAGLALAGKRPFLSIYSTFLQRAYDQINHDIARMDLPVVIGIDRAGLVGEDGDTHHGVFDIGLLKPLPNLIIAQPKDAQEAQNLLYTAFKQDHPFAIRYPRGNEVYKPVDVYEEIDIGKWELIKIKEDRPQAIILTYGKEVSSIISKIKENDFPWWVVNMRFIKPLDEECLRKLFSESIPLFIYETDMLSGGLAESILRVKNETNSQTPVYIRGINDHYVTHGSMVQLRKEQLIDTNSVVSFILETLD